MNPGFEFNGTKYSSRISACNRKNSRYLPITNNGGLNTLEENERLDAMEKIISEHRILYLCIMIALWKRADKIHGN